MAPTVDDIMSRTSIGCGWHLFASMQISAEELRAALEEAYDPFMPSWPSMVELD